MDWPTEPSVVTLTSFEFQSSKGTAVRPEEELEDLVCDVTCAIVTILRVQELIVVTSEDPINRFTNKNPRVSH
jgi:hypothetical protein